MVSISLKHLVQWNLKMNFFAIDVKQNINFYLRVTQYNAIQNTRDTLCWLPLMRRVLYGGLFRNKCNHALQTIALLVFFVVDFKYTWNVCRYHLIYRNLLHDTIHKEPDQYVEFFLSIFRLLQNSYKNESNASIISDN